MQLPFKYFSFWIFLTLLPLAGIAQGVNPQSILWIANFEDEDVLRSVGTWEHNIMDPDQSIKVSIVGEATAGKREGKVLRLDFDVDSPNPAMVGVWIKLQNQDLSSFDTLHLSLRSGDGERFRGSVAVQFTDSLYRKAAYLVSNVKEEWKEYRIPLKKFARIANWSQVKEFEIIIDDINANPKEGSLFVDEIYVSSSKAGEASYR